MTREETLKVILILKTAYPYYYKDMPEEQAKAAINLWSMHFTDIPYELVALAVNKIISDSPFPPTIAMVKAKLSQMYSEAVETMVLNKDASPQVKLIADTCRDIEKEPHIAELSRKGVLNGFLNIEQRDGDLNYLLKR